MRSRMSLSEEESATRHCRTSPGGRTPSSSRRVPVEPPSSAMATMAVRSKGYFFRPDSTVNVPVPPPITTIFLRLVIGASIILDFDNLGGGCRTRTYKPLAGPRFSRPVPYHSAQPSLAARLYIICRAPGNWLESRCFRATGLYFVYARSLGKNIDTSAYILSSLRGP